MAANTTSGYVMKKSVVVLCLAVLLSFSLYIRFNTSEVKALNNHTVRNINTGLIYTSIQTAVDAPETVDGHTILVEEGTYYEHVEINKSLSLIGENKQTTIIDGNQTGRVVRITASCVYMSGFTIRNSGPALFGEGCGGICLGDKPSGNIIRDNTITNGSGGIEIFRSRKNVIQDNVLSNNWKFGMDLYDSAENIIRHNIIADNGYGLSFDLGSTRNEVYDNVVLSNGFGVYLNYAPQNTFRNNNLTDNDRGLGLGLASGLEDFDQDIDTSNLINGKPVCYLVNQQDILIDPSAFPNGVGYIGIVGSKNVTVRDLSVSGNSQGVLLACTKNSRLQNLTVSNCDYGLHIEKSTRNAAVDCRLSSTYGVWLVESDENSVYNNTISDAGFGIEFYFDVSGNTLSRNNVTSCTFGITSYPCYNNSVTENVVSNCSSGISLRGSSNTIVENNVSYCEYGGVDIRLSNFTVVSGNVLTLNGMGIWVTGGSGGGSDFNIVSGNTLVSNEHGFDVRYCSNNIFYHNNVINNTVQAYLIDTDNKGDSNGEGNYWSDHNPPDQEEDKIGDAVYVIDENNIDNYPLIYPYATAHVSDLNRDGKVNIIDITIVAKAFKSKPGDLAWNAFADMDESGIINIIDIARVAKEFEKTT